MTETQAKKKGTGKPGRPPKHGAYSLIARGELPQHRTYIREYLTDIREGLIADLGPREADLTAAQLVLVDRAIAKLGVLRCIEEHVRETDPLRGNRLVPCLANNYITFSNSLRLDLQALGIDQRVVEEAMSLRDITEQIISNRREKEDGRE